MCRLPFGLRGKLDKKLDELLEKDIIEEVSSRPTEWVSPYVEVPKLDGDIQICVNMHRAKEAIVRKCHPLPTIEEVLYDLNGSTVFSKLDLKWGFHHIELEAESCEITTFITHRGLYRYKRLYEEKVASIRNAEQLQNASEVRLFLGLVQYLLKFLPEFAEPLRKLTGTDQSFLWSTVQRDSFAKLKEL